MKRLFYLVTIISLPLIVFFEYDRYRRFHPPSEYGWPVHADIDPDYHDPEAVKRYIELGEGAASYARYIWKKQGIDVKRENPSDPEAKAYADTYRRYLASARHLEQKLLQSADLKKRGFSNEQIRRIEQEGISPETLQIKELTENKVLSVIGDEGPLVFEIQTLLKKRGLNLPVDGIFRDETDRAIRLFQQEQSLYPSGKMDERTFRRLLQ
jgi:Putative peptidoglycan binding domain